MRTAHTYGHFTHARWHSKSITYMILLNSPNSLTRQVLVPTLFLRSRNEIAGNLSYIFQSHQLERD